MEYWTAFILGLAGSLHCAGMCGPLALALPSAGQTALSRFGERLIYNLGRISTYCVLGLVLGLCGKTLFLAGMQQWVSLGLGLALILGLVTSKKLALWTPLSAILHWLKASMSAWFHRRSLVALGMLGLFNGLLPCGLVYVAGAGAMATGDILAGAQYMAIFGLGTVPMMFALGMFGSLIPTALRLKLRTAVPVAVFLLAALLILRGMALDIPFLSPLLIGNLHHPASCH